MTNNIIGFIGAGNMASALISGLINSGHNPRDLMASSPEDDHLDSIKQSFNIAVTKENGEIFNKCNTIIFAVKPNILGGVLQKYSNQISFTNHLLISIAAGVLIKKIELSLNKNQRIIRAMPNTPASIKSAVTALCKNTNANKDDKSLAENIFSSVGTTCWLDENSMDLYTALIGSGPAYIFYIIESLLATSAELGFDKTTTKRILADMIIGSAKLAKQSKDSPEILREKVTSPGGVTQRALEIFEENNIKKSIILAITEAKKRSKELGN